MKRPLEEKTSDDQMKSSKIVPTAPPFSSETLTQILTFLDARDVVNATMVSSQWNSACVEYQETLWKAVCYNCLNNLEKYPFMKNVEGGTFDIKSYEGIYPSWKENYVELFNGQLKEFTSQYQNYLEIFADADDSDNLLETIKKKSTLAIPYSFAGQQKQNNEDNDENEGEEEEKEEKEENDEEGEESGPKDNTPIGCSKIGGLPDLPKGAKWPNVIDDEETLLRFICQINLSDLKKYHSVKGILPQHGWLFCFIDWENLESDDYKEPYSFYWNGPISMLERNEPEEGLEYEKNKALQIKFKDEVVQPISQQSCSRFSLYEKFNDTKADLGTSIMGYPQAVQAEEEMISDDRYFILQYQHSSLDGSGVDTADSVFYWMLPLESHEKIKNINKDEEIRVPIFTTFQC